MEAAAAFVRDELAPDVVTARLEEMLTTLLPMLQPTSAPDAQLGSALCLRATVDVLGERVLPYAALLIAPIVAFRATRSAEAPSTGTNNDSFSVS